MIMDFPWMNALIGGILIGVSATVMLAWNGQITGISGMVHRLVERPSSPSSIWRWFFLAAMILGGVLYSRLAPAAAQSQIDFAPGLMILGGLLVGFGTRMGGGCTSGHGVCGLGRLSLRSIVAVATFVAAGMATVYVVRHLLPALI